MMPCRKSCALAENRLTCREKAGSGQSASTDTYDGDGLNRTEFKGAALTTLVWDGDEYLGEV